MSVSIVLDRDAGPLVAGEPLINLVPATLLEHLGTPVLAVYGQQVPVPGLLRRRPSLRRHLGRRIVLGVRPEHLQDAVVGRPAAAGPVVLVLHGVVRQLRPAGAERIVHVELADVDPGRPAAPAVVARVSDRSNVAVGGAIMLAVDARHLMVFDAGHGPR
ncbi:TOBE domain-containing protein [Dactylosporangium sp. NPDC049525]|uniref:TOBE domain-containing protein n=1 Tax=Dactylosporangium sp. NPDC049525 TaxID=3154730 RepID=UPI003442E127